MFSFIKYLFITVFLSITTAVYLLCFTPAGLQYELQWLAKHLPGKLIIEKVDGTLFYGFRLQNLSYETSDAVITIKSLELHLKPERLLQKKIEIEKLFLENTKIKLNTAHSSENKFDLNHASFLESDNKFDLNHVGYLKYVKLNHLQIKHLSIEKSDLLIQLDGDIRQQWNMKWEARIQLSELHSDYSGSLNTSGTISGPRFSPTILAIIRGNHLDLDNHLIKKLEGQAEIHIRPHTTSMLQLSATDVHLEDYFFKKLNMTIMGNIAYVNNQLSALLTMKMGGITIPGLGIHPENIALQAKLENNNKIMTLSGQFQSGHSTAKLAGTLDFSAVPYPLNLSIQGHNLQAVNLPEYKILISPDLNIHFAYPSLRISGKVTIPFARITPKDFSETQTLPEEVVFVNQTKPTSTFSLSPFLQIDLQLGDDVFIHYDKLQTRLNGNIVINKDEDTPAIATGELYTVDGTYTAYSNKLAIETGRLIYTGNSLTNPGLDIQAVKKMRRVVTSNTSDHSLNTPAQSIYAGSEMLKVGVQISGTFDRPRISLFSVPADLNQGDILSYLLLGFPQANATGSQSTALLSVISSLYPGTSNITHIQEKLEKTLGLTELNVGSIQTFNPISKKIESNTAVMVGKQLTDKLSIHYSIGLFDPVSVLNLRYQINTHWALQSETSSMDNGADLVYVFERD